MPARQLYCSAFESLFKIRLKNVKTKHLHQCLVSKKILAVSERCTVTLNVKMPKPFQRNPGIFQLLPAAYLTKPWLSPDVQEKARHKWMCIKHFASHHDCLILSFTSVNHSQMHPNPWIFADRSIVIPLNMTCKHSHHLYFYKIFLLSLKISFSWGHYSFVMRVTVCISLACFLWLTAPAVISPLCPLPIFCCRWWQKHKI